MQRERASESEELAPQRERERERLNARERLLREREHHS
jgi:hypothetical protein